MSSHCSRAGRWRGGTLAADDLAEEYCHDYAHLSRTLRLRHGGDDQRLREDRRPGRRCRYRRQLLSEAAGRPRAGPVLPRWHRRPAPGVCGLDPGPGAGAAIWSAPTVAWASATPILTVPPSTWAPHLMSWAFPATWPAASSLS